MTTDYFGLRLDKDIGCNRSGSLGSCSSLSWLFRRVLALSRQRYKQSPRWKTYFQFHNLFLSLYELYPLHRLSDTEREREKSPTKRLFFDLHSLTNIYFLVDLYSLEDPPYPSEDHYEKMGGEK